MIEHTSSRAPGLARRPLASRGSARTWAAFAFLLAAVTATVALPPGPAALGATFLATALLATDRRLGPLGAALLVILVLPFGRAADNDVFRVSDFPVRPQDVAIGVGLVLLLPLLRRPRRLDVSMAAVTAFLALGVVAVVIGLVGDNLLRDVTRDTRWWFLYGAALVALSSRMQRRQLLRALLVGATLYSLVLLATLLLPAWDGGIKHRALEYGWGITRLQFSNSPFVIAAAVYVASDVIRRPRLVPTVILFLLVTATALSVTRMSLLVLATALVLVAILAVVGARRRPPHQLAKGLVVVVACAVIAVPVGLGLVAVVPRDGLVAMASGPEVPSAGEPNDPEAPGDSSANPFDRVLFQDEGSSARVIDAGRIGTYREALKVIGSSPLVGSGLGVLVDRSFTFGGSEPATPGKQPGVDNAYLTVAMKTGVIGAISYLAMMLAPLWIAARRLGRRRRSWFLPAWLAILALTVTQSFATSGYGPLAVALLLAYPSLARPSGSNTRRRPADGS